MTLVSQNTRRDSRKMRLGEIRKNQGSLEPELMSEEITTFNVILCKTSLKSVQRFSRYEPFIASSKRHCLEKRLKTPRFLQVIFLPMSKF